MQGGDTRFKKGHKTILVSEKVCKNCGLTYKPSTNRQKYCGSHSGKSGCSWKNYLELCVKKSKVHNEIRKLIPNYNHNSSIKGKYGITHTDYEYILRKQNNTCAICNLEQNSSITKHMFVDHNHKTGKIRGLLCSKCNFGLGNFKDDIELLENAIKYLKNHEDN